MKKKHKPNQVYELPDKVQFAEKYMLGLDPGSRNFGIALVGLRPNGKPKVLLNSVMMHPVNDLINFPRSSDAFLKELGRWIDLVKIDGICAERFQTRGNGGPLIEQVSAMLGLIRGRHPNIPIKLTVASAWKNRITRRFDVKLKDDTYPNVDVQPHQLDASLIGIFGLESGLGRELPYSLDRVIEQCEETSLIGLRKRKTR